MSLELLRCTAPSGKDGARLYTPAPQTVDTDIRDFRLRQTQDQIEAVARAAGGSAQIGSAGGETVVRVMLPLGGTRLDVALSPTTGRAREITLFGPKPASRSMYAFAFEAIRRFGPPVNDGPVGQSYNTPPGETLPWLDHDGIGVEVVYGSADGQAPMTMHLVDMTDPKSRHLRPQQR
jgi:hypothetical protein